MATKAPKKAAKKKDASLGKVVHYYDKLGVAIIKLKKPLKVGECVTFKRGEQEFSQVIDSMQMNHENVQSGKKGQDIGVKVSEPIKEGAVVTPAEECCSCCT